ncbi:uncharacterized protein LOC110822093 isoform X2 [Carica papaya]|uniref:uncharacterized protein LOC110822093 isoform X2 n=1 Tax=Carica papaya TaxID=3649 RepID=UPI000B8CB37B|nr:uncharacterized protein LOC110822093 isoform X2 [Carica papaya]
MPTIFNPLTHLLKFHKRKTKKMVSKVLRKRSSKALKKKTEKVIMKALLHIFKLKLKMEAINREYSNLLEIKKQYLNLIKQIQLPKALVKVVKIEQGFLLRITCNQGGDHRLVAILERLEEMGLNVVQARVSCTSNLFTMEAIAAADDDRDLDVSNMTQALANAINGDDQKQKEKINQDCKSTDENA